MRRFQVCQDLKGLDTPNYAALSFLSVNGKTSKKIMTHRGETTRSAMLFFEVLPFTNKKRHDVVLVCRSLMFYRLPTTRAS